jgi:transcriptional antiterminator NusG
VTGTETLMWYALRTRSRFEKVVRDQLTGRGVEPLLPLVQRLSQWKDRKKLVEWPLFPGYCFARFAPDQQLRVLQAPGVVEIIGNWHGPEAIPDAEIVALQLFMQQSTKYESYPYLGLKEGMLVEVIRGPLQGLRGKFVRRAAQCRFVIAINLISQATAVEIDAEDVAPVAEGNSAQVMVA